MRNILLLMLVLISTPAFSHHIVGGEITYTHVFDDLYDVTLKLYRDCFSDGAEFDDPAVIAVYDGNGNFINDHNVTYSSITPVNNLVSDSCAGSNYPCVEVAEYHFDNVVFSPGANYYIVYQRCCRNDGIYNLLDVNGSEEGATYVAFLPLENGGVNNSPVSNNYPLTTLFNNQSYTVDVSSTDVDGDYLSYHLCAAFNGATEQNPQPLPPAPPPYETCVYESPYSFSDPIGPGNIVLDSITGMLSVSPTVSGRFVVAVRIKEFKNGNLISNSYRDFEFDVVECFGLAVPEVIANDISISPNPVENVLVIANDLVGEHITHVNLYSTDGRLLLALDFTKSLIEPKTIDFSDFAKGFYILQVRTNKNSFTKSLVKVP